MRIIGIRTLLFIIIGFSVHFVIPIAAAETSNSDVLVVHDGKSGEPNISRASAIYIQQLLGHFSLRSDICSIDDYRSGRLTKYRFGFFISKSNRPAPVALIRDIKLSNYSFFWINSDVEAFGRDFLREIGLESVEYKSSSHFRHVAYKGKSLVKRETSIWLMKVTNPKLCRVYAWALAPEQRIPYVVQTGKLWIAADCPFSYSNQHDSLLVFADLLHDFLGIKHDSVKRVIFRVEDVNASSDPAALSRLGEALQQRGVPFAVSVIPYYVAPQLGPNVPISDRPDLVRSLRKMVDAGGSIIIHGYTHQYRGTTASDFEFWDPVSSKPGINSSPEIVHARIEKGVNTLLTAGLYPLAWETPHYAASNDAYTAIGAHFSTSLEPKAILDRLDYSQSFPFIIERDIYGQRIIPENLGYVPYKRTKSGSEDIASEMARVREILQAADDSKVLRDSCLGVFFHPFLNSTLAATLTDGLKSRGYRFVDLRREPNTVRTSMALIGTRHISGTINMKGQYLRETYINADGTIRHKVSPKPIFGPVRKSIKLPAGCIYVCKAVSNQTLPTPIITPAQNSKSLSKGFTARAAIIWNRRAAGGEKVDQFSLERAFASIAVKPKRIEPSELGTIDLSRFNLIIVPMSSARRFTSSQSALLADAVKSGAGLLTDGPSPLAEHFGFKESGTDMEIKRAKDIINNQALTWQKNIHIHSVSFPRGAAATYTTLDEQPIGGWVNYGKGKCFFLSALFDPITSNGYARFPSLPAAVLQTFKLRPNRLARDIELYFDPGYQTSQDIEPLVEKWRRCGVRAIHAAAWYINRGKRYNYEKLIETCHKNGILVYAWFELPYVSIDFYNAHPEWHEKTAAGTNSNPGWRLPVAMEIPECRAEVGRLVGDILQRYDWDGANLAELYFECEFGPSDAKTFSPMHPYVRKEFRRRFGYDAADLFNPKSLHYWKTSPASWHQFDTMRAEMLRDIYIDMLEVLDVFHRGTAKTGKREVVVTVLDSINALEIRLNTGLDVKSIVGMMRAGKGVGNHKFDFTLNIEDPQRMWSDSPNRYAEIGEIYRGIVSDPKKLMLNMNVLDFRKPGTTPFATLGQTGAELATMILSAKSVVPRVLIYCESSISESDLALLPAMMASTDCWDENGQCTHLEYPCSSYLQIDDSLTYVRANGKCIQVSKTGEVPLVEGTVNIEQCNNMLNWLRQDVPVMHLSNVTGSLLGLNEKPGLLLVEYDSLAPCLISVDQEVVEILIDGKHEDVRIWKSDGKWVLRCPAGHHEAKIVTKSQTLFHLEVVSSLLSRAIVFVGYGAALLGFSLAMSIIIKRRSFTYESYHK